MEESAKNKKLKRLGISAALILEMGIGYIMGVNVGPESVKTRDINGDGIQDITVMSNDPLNNIEHYFYGVSTGDSTLYLSKDQIEEMYKEKAKEFYFGKR